MSFLRFSAHIVTLGIGLALPSASLASVRLPNLISDHAVLQRNQPVRIWGTASAGEHITVRFHMQTLSAVADEFGAWEVWLSPERAGGPYSLSVSGSMSPQPVVREDLLMGDVWLASGQSNMEFPMEGWPGAPLKGGARAIPTAELPEVRLLLQTKATSPAPVDDIPDRWQRSTPEAVQKFSAIAFLFGRELNEREHVPIGIIDASWGGTPAHSWISPESLAYFNLTSVFIDAGNIAKQQGRADGIDRIWEYEDAATTAAGKVPAKRGWAPGEHKGAWTPGAIFNAVIAPDTRYTIKGVIWYQGEADTDPPRSPYYARVFPALILDWRRQWAEGDFPFLFVQISSYDAKTNWPEVRDAQRRTLALRNTAMVVSLDAGEHKQVHPADKQTVAQRLVLAARSLAYSENVEYQSPEFVSATSDGPAMRAWFRHAKGLHANGEILGFEVAGDDRIFQPATARVDMIGDQVTVIASSPLVSHPHYMRFAWQNYVTSYLYNDAGLPLGTFTSE